MLGQVALLQWWVELAGQVLVHLLVPVPDVLLQGAQPLVAALTVGAGQQLGA